MAPFRDMRSQVDQLSVGTFIAEDPKVVQRLLRSHIEVLSVVMSPDWRPRLEPFVAARANPPTLLVVEKRLLEQITGYRLYQGVMALARVPAPIPEESLLSSTKAGKHRLLLVADGLTNAENVGSLIRSAVAMGVDTLVSGENSAHPYLRRSVRSSMGNIFQLPYFRATDLVGTLRRLESAGIPCLAAIPRPSARTLWETDFDRDLAIVLGAEGPGVRPEVAAACSGAVSIPMDSGVDSLNVGSAAAVLLAECARQRRQPPR